METVRCASCSMTFGVDERLVERLRESGETFYCPKGHPSVFRPSENDKLKINISDLKEQVRLLEEWGEDIERTSILYRRQRDSYKGHFGRIKRKLDEVEDQLRVASDFPENAQEIKKVLREFECFDQQVFDGSGGGTAYAQLLNMVIQYNRYEHRIEDLENQAIRVREYYEQRLKNQTVS